MGHVSPTNLQPTRKLPTRTTIQVASRPAQRSRLNYDHGSRLKCDLAASLQIPGLASKGYLIEHFVEMIFFHPIISLFVLRHGKIPFVVIIMLSSIDTSHLGKAFEDFGMVVL